MIYHILYIIIKWKYYYYYHYFHFHIQLYDITIYIIYIVLVALYFIISWANLVVISIKFPGKVTLPLMWIWTCLIHVGMNMHEWLRKCAKVWLPWYVWIPMSIFVWWIPNLSFLFLWGFLAEIWGWEQLSAILTLPSGLNHQHDYILYE